MVSTPTEPLTRRGVPVDPSLRILALGSFANRFGAGAVATTSAIYFTRKVGMSATEIGFALGFAALIGLLVAIPAGHLGDTMGPRKMLIVFLSGSAVCAALPALARTPAVLAVLLGLYTMFERSASSVYQGFIAQLAGPGRNVLFRAYLRAVTNTALGLGSLIGGLALVVDETWAYLGVFVLDAVFTGFAAWNSRRLPHLPGVAHEPGESRWGVLRDWPYVAVIALRSIYTMHFMAMEIGLALYISMRTNAPNVMVAVVLAINTAAVALFQVRLARRTDSVQSGARAFARASGWIVAGFAVIALASTAGPDSVWLAVVLLVVGALLHVVGEMIGSGGDWGVVMGLAPMERQGQYQGFAGMAFSLAQIIGPPLVTFLCVTHGPAGWLVLAAVIVAAALAMGPVSRWALNNRERYGVTSHSG